MDEVLCSICLESIKENGMKLECNHYFHNECSEKWLRLNQTCPICRTEVKDYVCIENCVVCKERIINDVLGFLEIGECRHCIHLDCMDSLKDQLQEKIDGISEDPASRTRELIEMQFGCPECGKNIVETKVQKTIVLNQRKKMDPKTVLNNIFQSILPEQNQALSSNISGLLNSIFSGDRSSQNGQQIKDFLVGMLDSVLSNPSNVQQESSSASEDLKDLSDEEENLN